MQDIILEFSIGSTHMAQALDSLCYTGKTLITNKVMTIFFRYALQINILHPARTSN